MADDMKKIHDREVVAKYNGVIKSTDWHDWVIRQVVESFGRFGFRLCGITESPVKGGSGNTEFLACFRA